MPLIYRPLITLSLALTLAIPGLADTLPILQIGGPVSVPNLTHYVETLASDDFAGRLTGHPGGIKAEDYTASVFETLGLAPAGEEDSFFQAYTFTAGIALGEGNRLEVQFEGDDAATLTPEVDTTWRPLAFSRRGEIPASPVVFAGYGIVAPAEGEHPGYDSYVHLDVEDKWVLAFRYLPEDVTPERRQHLARYAGLRYKAMAARDKGARGLMVVSGPRAQARNELVRLSFDVSVGSTSLAALTIADDLAATLLEAADKDLDTLQAALDTGEAMMGFVLPGVSLDASISLDLEERNGRNVLAKIEGADTDLPAVVIGAHLDHLGPDEESGAIHYGADDNASGIAALLEVARILKEEAISGQFTPRRSIIFGAWTGEELGLLGSEHYTKSLVQPHSEEDSIAKAIAAHLNMDMVGRLDEKLTIHGNGSSADWKQHIGRAAGDLELPLDVQDESYLPTDATSFYKRGVPILSIFTGVHEDYHTPADTPDKLNYDGLAEVTKLVTQLTRQLAEAETAPTYAAVERPREGGRMGMRAYLGTIPDYQESDAPGLRLSGVAENGPAAKAGLQEGDLVIELAGQKVENIYDYTYAIEALKIGEATKVVIIRNDEELSFEVTPESRE